jgi:hypothetical protein
LLQRQSFISTDKKAVKRVVLKNNLFIFTNLLHKALNKSLLSKCCKGSISVEKRGHLLLPLLRSHTNKKKSKKGKKRENTKNKKYISARRVYQNAQEITENWLKKIKYTRSKNMTKYFRLMNALLIKKI